MRWREMKKENGENKKDEKNDKALKRMKGIRKYIVGEAKRGEETVEEDVYREQLAYLYLDSLLTYDHAIISIFKISFLVALCTQTPASI
jgi:hypothetical protein